MNFLEKHSTEKSMILINDSCHEVTGHRNKVPIRRSGDREGWNPMRKSLNGINMCLV